MKHPGHLTKITDENRAIALGTNQEVAACRSLLVLYARMFVFRVFLGITENHKGRWLLIQVAPSTLLATGIFLEFIQLMGRAPYEYLSKAIECDLITISGLLEPQSPVLFCVLDEAQVPTNMFSDRFLSSVKLSLRGGRYS